jgi:CRP-like cAMP-binding protein
MTEVEQLRDENARLRRWLRLSVRERLVEHLLSVARRVDGELVITRPGSQSKLAEAIGTTARESVSRALSQLEREGFIVRRRSRISVETVGMTLAPALEQLPAGWKDPA